MSGLEKEIAEQEKKYLTLLSTKFKSSSTNESA